MTKVTVYIPCFNYAHFLDEAVGSVVAQSYTNWELLIINDGSTDETAVVARQWVEINPHISLRVHDTPLGLPSCANAALASAKGEYIMRLDADDYLDENALLVLVNYLDQHPKVALVYPNFVHVSKSGRHLGIENRKRIGKEAELLDLPAHGACTMVRRAILEKVNGYSESQDRQDGYELWLKIARQYPVANVETPLFFYRHHGTSLSEDEGRLLEARRRIKRAAVTDGSELPSLGCCVAVVPAKNTYDSFPNMVLEPVGGRPLIDHTLEAALAVDEFKIILVSTDDSRVADYARRFSPKVQAYIRPKELSAQNISDGAVLFHALEYLDREHKINTETVVSLAVNCPLRRKEHIQEALDTFSLFRTEMVISVYEDFGLHFVHGSSGMEPLNPSMHLQIRLEREALYVWNGAVRVVRREVLGNDGFFTSTVGHVVMRYEESFQIKTEFDRWLVEGMLVARSGQDDAGTGAAHRAKEIANRAVRR